MSNRAVVGLTIASMAIIAAGSFALCRDEPFEITVVRDEAYRTPKACYRAERSPDDMVHVPPGARLIVTNVDWGGKDWPCFEATYHGERVFMTSESFEVQAE